MTIKLTKCPRAGDSILVPVPGVEGMAFRVLFSGPGAGRQWSQRFVTLSETHAANPDALVTAVITYIRGLVEAFATSVEGMPGFAPDSPAEALAALEFLTYAQAQAVVSDILAYQCPNLTAIAAAAVKGA